jgi:hypothetical protein
MKFAFRKLAIATLGLAALAFAHPASAGFETQTVTFGSSGSPLTNGSTATLAFAQFDTSLGTLTSVTIQVSDSMTVVSQAVSFGAGTSTYTNFENTGTVVVTGPDATALSTSLSTTPGSGTITGVGTVLNVDSETNNNLGAGPTNVSSANFGAYEGVGVGTFNVTAGANNSFSGSTSGAVAASGTTTSYGSVTITYTYTATAVPEPASMAMVGIGLGALVVVSRFRRRTA